MSAIGRISIFFMCAFVVVAIVATFFGFSNFTGKVSLELKSGYHEGEPLNGTLKLSLNQGELIPAKSTIVFESNSQSYEYPISDYISDKTMDGIFYVEGSSLSGNGSGYGLMGENVDYPTVEFKLNIGSESGSSGASSGTQATTNETANSSGEQTSSNENTTQEKTTSQETANETQSTNEEQTNANQSDGQITGSAILSIENEVSGEVSGDDEFTYDLGDGQTAEIVPGSVKTGSETLKDNDVKLKIENGQVIVTTNYQKKEEGFGKNFVGDKTKDLTFDLSKFNLNLPPGDVTVKVTYEGNDLISLATSLNEGEITVANKSQIPAKKPIEIISPLSPPENITEIVDEPVTLTDSERKTLKDQFGNESVKITKAERTSDAIIVRYELGDYWVEHSYAPDTPTDTLKQEVEEDRTRFLKDLAKKFSEIGTGSEELSDLIGEYKI